MTSHQLQKTSRNCQGLSDPLTYRGSFSSPSGAYYPLPDTLLQLCNCATSPMPASCMVAWLQQNEGGAGLKTALPLS
jgi:hypothetical protein